MTASTANGGPLVSLNYYDGRFLRADDLNLEREGQRAYADLGQRSGGPGVVYGFDVAVDGTTQLRLSAGLAVDPSGRLLYLPNAITAAASELLGGSPRTSAATESPAAGFAACGSDGPAADPQVVGGSGLYRIVLRYARQAYGRGEVFGRLCDDGCRTPTDGQYLIDGVRLLLQPWQLHRPLPSLPGVTHPEMHLRSQVAAAYFGDEWDDAASLLDGNGLRSPTWCAGAPSLGGDVVPIGMLSWNGATIDWLDAWTARRERMDGAPRNYWFGRLEQRPWPVFLAQVLQFQCQLQDLGIVAADALTAAGIVECPPAGYLPVDRASMAGVRAQVQAQLGAGVELRVCAVRRDQIAHELERAQHMDRISLLRGLIKAADREQVDILVPDGVLETEQRDRASYGFAVDVAVGPTPLPHTAPLGVLATNDAAQLPLQGVGRLDVAEGITARVVVAGSAAAGLRQFARLMSGIVGTDHTEAMEELGQLDFGTEMTSLASLREVGRRVVGEGITQRASGTATKVLSISDLDRPVLGASVALWVAKDPFELADQKSTSFTFGFDLYLPAKQSVSIRLEAAGQLLRQSMRTGTIGPELLVTLTGDARAATTGIGSTVPSGLFILHLVLRRGQQDGKDTFAISNDLARLLLGFSWSGRPIQATGALLALPKSSMMGGAGGLAGAFSAVIGGGGPFPQPPAPRVVGSLQAREDERINQPGDDHRDAAIAGLQILSGLYPADPRYVEHGYAELFPADTSSVHGRIRPTTDWVLFRRRRRRECEGTIETPAAGLSKVAVWLARAADIEQAGAYATAMFGSQAATVPWTQTPVDTVEFEAGTATLRSTSSAWRQRYDAAGGGTVVYAAGYGSAPGASDAPVGVGRTTTLIEATAPQAALELNGRVDELRSPPVGRLVAGTDGSIFMVTYDDDPVEVFSVDGFDKENLEVLTALAKGTSATIDMAAAQIPRLARVEFPPGVGSQQAIDLHAMLERRLKQISELHDNLTMRADATIWTAKGLKDPRLTRAQEHADAVLEGLGLSPADATRVTADFAPGSGAPVRIYLVLSLVPDD